VVRVKLDLGESRVNVLTAQELVGDLAALEGAGVEHEAVVGDLAPVEEAPPVGLERACGNVEAKYRWE
jgi:hypothetical protein